MTRAEAAKLVAALLAIYPNAVVSTATSVAYERLLGDLDFAVAEQAIDRLAKLQKFLPTVAEIRLAADEIVHGPKRLGLEAWGDVVEQIRRAGAYQDPKFTDPVVAECVGRMGWRNLCLTENETADRARFVELYGALSERARLDRVSGVPLPPASDARRLPPARDNRGARGPAPVAGILPGRKQ